MRWIYLSPHLDDAAYSCGGLIWEQVQSGAQVEIWTICAGDPPREPFFPFAEELHQRWGTSGQAALTVRRAEDRAACARLGAVPHHFDLPDCIYRRQPGSDLPLVERSEDLFRGLNPVEQPLVDAWAQRLGQALEGEIAQVVSPLTLGGHMDHALTRAAAEKLGRRLWYYPDYPYAAMHAVDVPAWLGPGWEGLAQVISDQGLEAWQAAVAAYASQVSSFWPGTEAMRAAVAAYAQTQAGFRLWRKIGESG